LDAALCFFRSRSVHRVDLDHRVELLFAFAFARLAHLTDDRVAATQAESADHRERHVDVVFAGEVSRGANECVVVEDIKDACGRYEDIVFADGWLDVHATVLTTAASATVATTRVATELV